MSTEVVTGFEQVNLVLLPEQPGTAQSGNPAADDCNLFHVSFLDVCTGMDQKNNNLS